MKTAFNIAQGRIASFILFPDSLVYSYHVHLPGGNVFLFYFRGIGFQSSDW